jgi:hypothetical protein
VRSMGKRARMEWRLVLKEVSSFAVLKGDW